MYRTKFLLQNDIERKWYVVDASGQPIGRLAARVATLLRGKHKPTFAPHQDVGDHVIIINAGKVRLTGNKKDELIYWHTMYPGGLKSVKRGDWHEHRPKKLLEKVVWGMMPKNRLGRAMYKKLKVYAENVHPHQAQCPEEIVVK
ncbi:MAG: 50S ribosomal protein L13 [bacterium]